MRRLVLLITAVAVMVAIAPPVNAITKGGSPDDGEHPYVGLMLAYSDNLIPFDADGDGVADDFDGDGVVDDDDLVREPLWRCSGSLISPTVFVTAGHCVGPESSAPDADTPAYASVWMNEDVQSQVGPEGYPYYENANAGNNAFTGIPIPHPDYEPDAFFLYDLGVVVLDGAGVTGLSMYASLPDEGEVDELGFGRKTATVEAVGYGLQNANKNHTVALRERMKADLFIVNRTGVAGLKQLFGFFPGSGSFLVSGDAANGGTCFGDSGGPMLRGDSDVLLGVNSFGLNANCAGVGGAYRIDQEDDLEFIQSFLD
jgi:hypothetical protein